MSEIIIAPSVLSLDFSDANKGLEELKKSKAKWLHFDVMDGHFVPNITFGQDIMKGFKKKTNLFMDVHLMISDPMYYAPVFIENGADMITFHYESFDDIAACKTMCSLIKKNKCKCGISIKPNTPVEMIDSLLSLVDMVLVMSVEPGFGGQSFQENSLDKIAYLDKKRKVEKYSYLIQVDGGINALSATKVLAVGCDVLVAGSYIFNNNIVESVESLLCLK